MAKIRIHHGGHTCNVKEPVQECLNALRRVQRVFDYLTERALENRHVRLLFQRPCYVGKMLPELIGCHVVGLVPCPILF